MRICRQYGRSAGDLGPALRPAVSGDVPGRAPGATAEQNARALAATRSPTRRVDYDYKPAGTASILYLANLYQIGVKRISASSEPRSIGTWKWRNFCGLVMPRQTR